MFIIYDTEYTTWQGCITNGWTGNQKKEIVQISALKVNDNFEVIDVFNEFCKPVINPILSDYFIYLTNITNEQIKASGILFEEAYAKFKKFVGNCPCCSHSWGGKFESKSDGDVIAQNLNLYNLPIDNSIKYYNLAEIFKQLYDKHNIIVKSQSSGQIVKILGIEDKLSALNLDIHNALYDVYSILEGLKYFYNDAQNLLLNKLYK